MAAIYLPIPGTKYGPCKEACEHTDCKATREDAQRLCIHCGEPMGYDRAIYLRGEDTPAHEVCLHVFHAKRRAEGDQV